MIWVGFLIDAGQACPPSSLNEVENLSSPDLVDIPAAAESSGDLELGYPPRSSPVGGFLFAEAEHEI